MLSQIILLIFSSILFHSILSSNFFTYSSSLFFLLLFHLFQFFSSFFRYSFLNFLLFYLYNHFTIYFLSNSILLNSSALGFHFGFHFFSTLSYFLTFISNFPSNSFTNSFTFPKSSSFSYISLSAVNPFHYTKYLSTPCIFLLFNIFLTSYSSTPFISIGLVSSFFCPSTCSLYHTILLTFTTGWILIEVGSCSLTTLVDTTSSIVYEPMY